MQEIKGFGPVGIDIFLGSVQHVWPEMAPFIDGRSLKTAETIELGGNTEGLWEAVGKDAVEMGRLQGALTRVRLEGREGEFR